MRPSIVFLLIITEESRYDKIAALYESQVMGIDSRGYTTERCVSVVDTIIRDSNRAKKATKGMDNVFPIDMMRNGADMALSARMAADEIHEALLRVTCPPAVPRS